MLTGRKASWSKMKVFGRDVSEFIANDKFTKVPGLPRGRKRFLCALTLRPMDDACLTLLRLDATMRLGMRTFMRISSIVLIVSVVLISSKHYAGRRGHGRRH
jgi:hypothetical protein